MSFSHCCLDTQACQPAITFAAVSPVKFPLSLKSMINLFTGLRYWWLIACFLKKIFGLKDDHQYGGQHQIDGDDRFLRAILIAFTYTLFVCPYSAIIHFYTNG